MYAKSTKEEGLLDEDAAGIYGESNESKNGGFKKMNIMQPLTLITSALLTTLIGCAPTPAYRGPRLPADQTATVRINPAAANIGIEITAVNDFPFLAEVDASVKAGRNTLHLNVWPTTRSNMELGGPAFATMHSRQDTTYGRKVSITFDAEPAMTYGIIGDFDMGYSPETASYDVQIVVLGTHEVVARATTRDDAGTARDIADGIRETQGEDWSLKAGPGS